MQAGYEGNGEKGKVDGEDGRVSDESGGTASVNYGLELVRGDMIQLRKED